MSPSDDVPPALPTDTRPALARDLQPIAEHLDQLQRAVALIQATLDDKRNEALGRYGHERQGC